MGRYFFANPLSPLFTEHGSFDFVLWQRTFVKMVAKEVFHYDHHLISQLYYAPTFKKSGAYCVTFVCLFVRLHKINVKF